MPGWMIYKVKSRLPGELKKKSTSLSMLKSSTVWIITNCGKFLEMGIPDHLTCLLRSLYAGEKATVKTGHGRMDWFQNRKGVR